MQLDVGMHKIVKIRVPDDTLSRVLTGIAEAAVKNKKHGLAVEAVEVLPPEVIDWPEGGTRLRYAGRVRMRQTKAKSPEKALKGFRYAFAMLAKRAKKIDYCSKEKGFTSRFGPAKAKVGIIGWGSTQGSIREGIELAAD